MKSRPPTPDGQSAPPAAHVRVMPTTDGRWTWSWVQTATGAELLSNTTYATQDRAVAAAERAYPELDVEVDTSEPVPDRPGDRGGTGSVSAEE